MFIYVYVLGPLVTTPVTDLDKVVNKLRQKYMTYMVEYVVDDVGLFFVRGHRCCICVIGFNVIFMFVSRCSNVSQSVCK